MTWPMQRARQGSLCASTGVRARSAKSARSLPACARRLRLTLPLTAVRRLCRPRPGHPQQALLRAPSPLPTPSTLSTLSTLPTLRIIQPARSHPSAHVHWPRLPHLPSLISPVAALRRLSVLARQLNPCLKPTLVARLPSACCCPVPPRLTSLPPTSRCPFPPFRHPHTANLLLSCAIHRPMWSHLPWSSLHRRLYEYLLFNLPARTMPSIQSVLIIN
jgi:hypothetical protein